MAETKDLGISSSTKFHTSDVEARRTTTSRKWWQFGGKDISFVSVDAGLDSETSSLDRSSSFNSEKGTNDLFHDPEVTELYKPIEGFEGTHRFDPTATWTPEEEKALVRKVCDVDTRKMLSNISISLIGVSPFPPA